MERIDTVGALKKGKFPKRIPESFPDEYVLLKSMLSLISRPSIQWKICIKSFEILPIDSKTKIMHERLLPLDWAHRWIFKNGEFYKIYEKPSPYIIYNKSCVIKENFEMSFYKMKTVDEALEKLSSSNIVFKQDANFSVKYGYDIYFNFCDPSTIENWFSFKSQFAEQFKLEKLLGKGSFGCVVQVTSHLDKHTYAIKRIMIYKYITIVHFDWYIFSNTEREYTEREVQTHVKLERKNVVRYYNSWLEEPPNYWMDPFKQYDEDEDEDYGSTTTYSVSTNESCNSKRFEMNKNRIRYNLFHFFIDEIPIPYDEITTYMYIQMELCDNGDLCKWLWENDSFDKRKDRYIDIFEQIVDGLRYIHEQGLIHRDLKPKNIFFNSSNTIKIGDFGLTAKFKDSTDADQRLSKFPSHTPFDGSFLAPEQYFKNYTYKVDIWALGIILLELLVYFDTGNEKSETIDDIKKGEFPEQLGVSFPDECVLLKSMLSQNPDERFSTYGIKAHSPFNEDVEKKYFFKMPFEI